MVELDTRIETKNKYGRTPLFEAAYHNNTEPIKKSVVYRYNDIDI